MVVFSSLDGSPSMNICSHVYVEVATQKWICQSHPSYHGMEDLHRIQDEVTAVLEGAELWTQLKQFQNEMVVGPQGRRMFPNFNVRLSGLSPTKFYHVFIEARPTDQNKFTFNYQTTSWIVSGPAETESNKRIYYHPETPLQGSGWMRKPISFKTPKFTTGQQEGNMIEIKKGQKYLLSLHLVEVSDDRNIPNKCLDFVFDETEFVTVSCHQNQVVAATKMNRNGRITSVCH
ncbi:T-box transcription factor mls-1-like [Bolinopsis microptera]|uniref:T-box transcription factor mls-1-like n=1 Tax=Bolinopsis microptera TaxID=2820187 RepID=UPI0030795841